MRILWLTAAASFITSALAATLAEAYFVIRVAIFGAFAGFQLSFNPGIAFGIRFAPLLQMFAILAALAAVIWMAYRSVHSRLEEAAFGLIVGGGLANVQDRLMDGVVTDFIQVGSFPIFNIADSCITIGVMVLLAAMFVRHNNEKLPFGPEGPQALNGKVVSGK